MPIVNINMTSSNWVILGKEAAHLEAIEQASRDVAAITDKSSDEMLNAIELAVKTLREEDAAQSSADMQLGLIDWLILNAGYYYKIAEHDKTSDEILALCNKAESVLTNAYNLLLSFCNKSPTSILTPLYKLVLLEICERLCWMQNSRRTDASDCKKTDDECRRLYHIIKSPPFKLDPPAEEVGMTLNSSQPKPPVTFRKWFDMRRQDLLKRMKTVVAVRDIYHLSNGYRLLGDGRDYLKILDDIVTLRVTKDVKKAVRLLDIQKARFQQNVSCSAEKTRISCDFLMAKQYLYATMTEGSPVEERKEIILVIIAKLETMIASSKDLSLVERDKCYIVELLIMFGDIVTEG